MKKIKFLACILFCLYSGLNAQTKTVNVGTAGTLSTLITQAETTTISTLTVTGNIDARDVAFMRDKLTILSVLNLSGASIKAYTGVDGTYSGISIMYPANELPLCAFYNANTLTYKATLTSVTLPTSLKSIGGSAFYYCYALSGTFSIPAGVTSIGSYALYGCSSLSAYSVDAANTRYSSTSGILYNKKQDSLFICPGAKTGILSIPSTVTYIGASAFDYCYSLTGSLTLPASLRSIGAYAFYYCSGFTGSLSIPAGVTSVGDAAFYGCSGLSGTVTIPASVTDIGYFCFFGCDKFTSFQVDAANTKYSSANDILYNKQQDTLFICPAAKAGTISIPATVKGIGSCAFYNCSSLTGNIDIPASTGYIGALAFFNCKQISAYNVAAGNSSYSSADGVLFTAVKDTLIVCPGAKTGSYSIPSTVKGISSYAFYYCSSLSGSLGIPASLTKIGSYAFYGCSQLSAFTVDAANPLYSSSDGVMFNKLQDSLYICPLGKTGSYTVPSTVQTIDYSAFDGCALLTSVTLPPNLKSIGTYAFEYCSGLTEIKIPKNLSSIGSGAFYSCTGLTKVMNASSSPQVIDTYTFSSVNKTTCQLVVPTGSSTTYRAATYWKDFSNISETNFDTAVRSGINSRLKLSGKNLTISIMGIEPNEEVSVYGINGTLIYSGHSTDSQLILQVSAHGCYAVRTAAGTQLLNL